MNYVTLHVMLWSGASEVVSQRTHMHACTRLAGHYLHHRTLKPCQNHQLWVINMSQLNSWSDSTSSDGDGPSWLRGGCWRHELWALPQLKSPSKRFWHFRTTYNLICWFIGVNASVFDENLRHHGGVWRTLWFNCVAAVSSSAKLPCAWYTWQFWRHLRVEKLKWRTFRVPDMRVGYAHVQQQWRFCSLIESLIDAIIIMKRKAKSSEGPSKGPLTGRLLECDRSDLPKDFVRRISPTARTIQIQVGHLLKPVMVCLCKTWCTMHACKTMNYVTSHVCTLRLPVTFMSQHVQAQEEFLPTWYCGSSRNPPPLRPPPSIHHLRQHYDAAP